MSYKDCPSKVLQSIAALSSMILTECDEENCIFSTWSESHLTSRKFYQWKNLQRLPSQVLIHPSGSWHYTPWLKWQLKCHSAYQHTSIACRTNLLCVQNAQEISDMSSKYRLTWMTVLMTITANDWRTNVLSPTSGDAWYQGLKSHKNSNKDRQFQLKQQQSHCTILRAIGEMLMSFSHHCQLKCFSHTIVLIYVLDTYNCPFISADIWQMKQKNRWNPCSCKLYLHVCNCTYCYTMSYNGFMLL